MERTGQGIAACERLAVIEKSPGGDARCKGWGRFCASGREPVDRAAREATHGRSHLRGAFPLHSYQSHGNRGRESILHTLAEMVAWFEAYVKSEDTAAEPSPQQ